MQKTKETKGPLSLRSRSLILVISLSAVALASLSLIFAFQDKVSTASITIREKLLPTSSLVEKTFSELGQQMREFHTFAKENPNTKLPAGLTRLSPATKSLMSLYRADALPKALDPLLVPWIAAAQYYLSLSDNPQQSNTNLIRGLNILHQRTELLKRSVERELSIQLLSLTTESQTYLKFSTAVFIINLLLMLIFLSLLNKWTSPLYTLADWIEKSTTSLPPRPLQSTGLLSAPNEIQKLHNAMRSYVLKVREQEAILESRRQSTEETEKAMGTLFSVLRHVMKHNEELLAQLIQKERLASMGEMAAELAHEIRNPLNSMNLKLELLREELEPSQQMILERVLGEIDRLDALTESHLRNTKATLQATFEKSELTQVVSQCIDNMKEEFQRKNIQVELDLNGRSPLSPLPESVLRAVMINLLKNASEAFNEAQSGQRRIKLSLEQEGESWALSILDNGCGFPEEISGKPFTSFQTTKSQGSGLGLATSQKMLKAWGLDMEIVFPPPIGFATCVRIFFRKSDKIESEKGNSDIEVGL